MKVQSGLANFKKELQKITNTTASSIQKTALNPAALHKADRFEGVQKPGGLKMPAATPKLSHPSNAGLKMPQDFLAKGVQDMLKKVFEAIFSIFKNIFGGGAQPPKENVQDNNSTGGATNNSTGGVTNNSTGGVTDVPGNTSTSGVVKTGLSPEVDALAAKSPSLQADLKQLQNEGWTIKYGAAGAGSTADRSQKVITIDSSYNAQQATQVLAHEVGHATYKGGVDYSTKQNYVNSMLADEGAATLNNIKVQREIIANGGPDVGIAGNSANHAKYNNIYDNYLKDGNAAKACKDIGAIFDQGERTSVDGKKYSEYYGNWYDSVYVPWKNGQS